MKTIRVIAAFSALLLVSVAGTAVAGPFEKIGEVSSDIQNSMDVACTGDGGSDYCNTGDGGPGGPGGDGVGGEGGEGCDMAILVVGDGNCEGGDGGDGTGGNGGNGGNGGDDGGNP